MSGLVSIIMPAHNVAGYIGDAIRSVVAQTYTNWELLVVDNNSTDSTQNIAENFLDPRIRFFSEANQGVSHARNKALLHARGEMICFLDADDLLPPKSIEVRMNYLDAHPGDSFCDGAVVTLSDDLKARLATWRPNIKGDVHHEMAKLQPRCFVTVTWMIRRAALGNAQFPVAWNHFEDRIFFLAISQNRSYAFIEDEIYHFRKRKNSSTTDHIQLESSYRRFMHEIQPSYLSAAQLKEEMKLFHSIFFRTYLKDGKIWRALMHLARFPK